MSVVDDVRAKHQPQYWVDDAGVRLEDETTCIWCAQGWPCDSVGLLAEYDAVKGKADLWDRLLAYEDRRNELDREFRSLPTEEQRRYKWWAGWAEEKKRRENAESAVKQTLA